MDGAGGEGQVPYIHGRGEGQGTYLSFRFRVMRSVPIEAFFGCIGIDEGRGAGVRRSVPVETYHRRAYWRTSGRIGDGDGERDLESFWCLHYLLPLEVPQISC